MKKLLFLHRETASLPQHVFLLPQHLYSTIEDLRINMIQSHIIWEDREENLGYYDGLLRRVNGRTNLAVLPGTSIMGFSMDMEKQADTVEGQTIPTIEGWTKKHKLAVVGSFITRDNRKPYNRAFFITPEGEEYYYDKRRLFRMTEEDKRSSAGNKWLAVPYKGWNICLQVCYDLRFPAWSRNANNEYDLLIYMASWPETREKVWKASLYARAIENMAYVCGVNRMGVGGEGFLFREDSMIYNAKGKKLADAGKREEITRTCTLEKSKLDRFRARFPAWRDADGFDIDF